MNLSEKLVSACGKPIENCTNRELYEALLTMVLCGHRPPAAP